LEEPPAEILELNASFLVMDAPRHTQLRRVVSGASTPRRLSALVDDVTAEFMRGEMFRLAEPITGVGA